MPTFGNTNIEPTEGSWELGLYQGCKFTKPETGKITHVLAYIAARAGTEGPSRGGLHDTNGNKIAESINEEQLTSTFAWHDYQFNTDELPAGDYWLVVGVASTVYIRIRYSSVAGAIYAGGSFSTYPTLPSTISALPYTLKMSIYGVYETGAPSALSVAVNPSSASLQVGQQRVFTAVVTGGTPPYTYRWLDSISGALLGNAATYVFNATAEGSYSIYLVVTDSLSVQSSSPAVLITVTTTPPPSDEIMFDNCDAIDNWLPLSSKAVDTQGDNTIEVDTIDKVEGTGSLKAVYASNAGNWGGMFYKRPTSGKWDFSQKPLLRIRMKIDKSLPNLHFGIVTGQASGWEGFSYTIANQIPIGSADYAVVTIDLRTPIPRTDGMLPDLTQVIQMHYSNFDLFISLPVTIHFDQITQAVGPDIPLAVGITPNVNKNIYDGDSLSFSASASGGKLPYAYAWYVNGLVASQINTLVFSKPIGTYNVYCEVTDSVGTKAQSPTVVVTVQTLPPPVVPTLPNFILLQDCPWITATGAPATMRNVLNQECREKLLRDLSYCNAKYVVVFGGYWDATDPAHPFVWHPHPITQEITPGLVRTAAYYQEFIAQCHALGIKVLVWLEDGGRGLMDISFANTRDVIIPIVLDVVNIGFDGFSDDVENWAGKKSTGNDYQDTIDNSIMQIPYFEQITQALWNIGKIHAPATGIDWVQYLNNHLVKVDYMLSMFYSNRTTLADPQCNGYWQEEFGELITGSHPTVTPPTAPLIIGLFFHINNSTAYDTMAEQIAKLDQLLSTYGHPNLHGFFIWFYETMKPEDWTAWNAWVKTFPSKGIPPPSSTVQHNLSILSATGGTTNPVSGNYPVYENTLQPVTAIPGAGMILDHWEFDGVSVGSSNPYAVLMDADHTLQPVFTQLPPSQVSLTVGVNPQGGGTTTPSPGTYAHTIGSSVQISATANPGYGFSHWELDGANVSTATFYSVVMDADHTITAVFSPMPISPPQLVHTQLWRLAHQQRIKLGVGWGFPLIELYDQTVIKMRNRGR